jgi:hypothetical protein
MPNQKQISVVVTAFEQWRSNRNGRQAPTPATLREQAVSLLNTFSFSQITSALRISGSQLKQWRNALVLSEQTPQFVNLPVSPAPTDSPFNVELCFASGDQLRLSGVVDRDVINTIIGAMKS